MRYALSVFAAVLLATPVVSQAAIESGIVTVEQNSARELGTWQLLYPGGILRHNDINVDIEKQTVRPRVGPLTLTLVPPAGATPRVKVYLNGTLISTETTRQKNIDLKADEEYRFVIEYIFNKSGQLGITSNMKDVQFRIVGPDGKTIRGKTPASYDNMPAGSYSIYPQKDGCVLPRPYNRSVKNNERTVVNVEIDCNKGGKESSNVTRRPVKSKRGSKAEVEAREKERAKKHRLRTAS